MFRKLKVAPFAWIMWSAQGNMVRNYAEELYRSKITKQGLRSHVKEFELSPPTINLYNSTQRVKLGCVPRITSLKPSLPHKYTIRNAVRG